MKGKYLINYTISMLLMIIPLIVSGDELKANTELRQWQSPFSKVPIENVKNNSLSFNEVLSLIAEANPLFKVFDKKLEAANEYYRQAGGRFNPELEFEIEEFGWDAPGFKETEMTFLLSQELEIFGQRGARKDLAETNIAFTRWENKKEAFDLYLTAKIKFFNLSHAQERVRLANEALELARSINNDISERISKGGALQSELMLSGLEFQKAGLQLTEAHRRQKNASLKLSSLWGKPDSNITIISRGISGHDCLKKICNIEYSIDSSSQILDLHYHKRLLESEKNLSIVESRPSLTLSGGYKRLQAEKSNSFVFGVSFPLPILNRNQGQRAGLQAEIKTLDYKIAQARQEILAEINTRIGEIVQLDEKLELIDTLLLVTAEKTYKSLQQAYYAGRIPYTSLLEGERALIELRFEKNDINLAIREEQVELERLIGIPLENIKKTEDI